MAQQTDSNAVAQTLTLVEVARYVQQTLGLSDTRALEVAQDMLQAEQEGKNDG